MQNTLWSHKKRIGILRQQLLPEDFFISKEICDDFVNFQKILALTIDEC